MTQPSQQTQPTGLQIAPLSLNSAQLIESLASMDLTDQAVAAGTLAVIKNSLSTTLRQDLENVNRVNSTIADLSAEIARVKAANDLGQQQALKYNKAASMLTKALTATPSIEEAAKISAAYGLEGDNAVRFAQLLLRQNASPQFTPHQAAETPQQPQQPQLDLGAAKPATDTSQLDLVERLKLAAAPHTPPDGKAPQLEPQMQMILNEVMALKRQNEELKQQSAAQEKARAEEQKRNHLAETLRKGIKVGEMAVAVSDENVLQFLVGQFAPQIGAMEFITVDAALAASLGLPQGQKVLADPGTGHTLDQLIKDFADSPVGAKLFERSSGTRGAGGISPNNSTVINSTTPSNQAGAFNIGKVLDVEGANTYGSVNMVKLEFAISEARRTGNTELLENLMYVKEDSLEHYSKYGKPLMYTLE